ncbi:ABC transporter permease [Hespellia stercorisuis]|uniref:Putative spermidine/putrescine transport system permease protein n=1 Tax=Hespellia stercorisuis DSM 15480 TaxID=1121950 RepID=A0A1M6N0S5_9FIRM|nr:ABC transporter permease subunit [Hespellia stercorisuis]SHJ89243.1 putative spermidine/putrescine transport system permease protein [Hespellia stercorisuis DSM 15480]
MQKKKNIGARIIVIIVIAYLLVPLIMTLIYSLFKEWIDVVPTGFTLSAYVALFTDPAFWQSVGRTVIISVIPIALCTVFVLLAMYVVVIYHPEWDRFMQILCTIPYAIQGVILPICVLSLYTSAPEPLNNRMVMLVATYMVVILPYVYQGIRNNIAGVGAGRMIEAAQMLGASKLYAFFRVVIPNIMSGVTVSVMLAMAIVFGDFVIINTLAGGHFMTAQMYMYDVMKKSGQRTCAVIIILFVVTLLISGFAFVLQSKQGNKKVK